MLSTMTKPLRILLIDDHRMFLDGMRLILSQLSEQIESMGSAREALDKLAGGARFDIILTDLKMPGLDGLSFLQALHARRLFIPTIVISGSDEPATISSALEQGAQGYLPKSAHSARIIEAIHKVLAGEIYVAPELPYEISEVPDSESGTANFPGLKLTRRQAEVLKLVADGLSNKDIALTLDISEATIKSHLNSIFQSLQVRNRTACVKRAGELGLLAG